jgi:hypothetical protein
MNYVSQKPADPRQLEDDKKVLTREWASLNGAVVRQRSVRQETTMAKPGTLPEGSYEVELVPNTASDSDPAENNDEILHYDDDESDTEHIWLLTLNTLYYYHGRLYKIFRTFKLPKSEGRHHFFLVDVRDMEEQFVSIVDLLEESH